MSKKSFLHPIPLSDLPWDSENAEASLQTVRSHVVADAESALGWYEAARQPKKRFGLLIRGSGVVLLAIAGLLPLIAQLVDARWPGTKEAATPYHINPLFASFAIGLAAALVGFDRWFGLSSGWMRYITTSLSIRSALQAFEMDWTCARAALRGVPPTPEQVDGMLTRCKEFAAKLNSLVTDETNTWVQEFQASLKQVDEALKVAQDDARQRAEALKTAQDAEKAAAEKQAEARKPGAINLTLTNRDKLAGNWKVQVDSAPALEFSGASAALSPVEPGLRTVRVFGIAGGKLWQEEKAVTVAAGTVLPETFTV
jgi:hypothetical protein